MNLSEHKLRVGMCVWLFPRGQVARLFHDESIGNDINIIVTRIIILTAQEVSLEITLDSLIALLKSDTQAHGRRLKGDCGGPSLKNLR